MPSVTACGRRFGVAEVRSIVQEERLPVPDRTVPDRLKLCGFGVTECLGRGVKAQHQRPAGVGQALDRLALSVVAPAQFDRVHVKSDRQLVHRRFEREQVRHLGR